jgi:hypothetical protein
MVCNLWLEMYFLNKIQKVLITKYKDKLDIVKNEELLFIKGIDIKC